MIRLVVQWFRKIICKRRGRSQKLKTHQWRETDNQNCKKTEDEERLSSLSNMTRKKCSAIKTWNDKKLLFISHFGINDIVFFTENF